MYQVTKSFSDDLELLCKTRKEEILSAKDELIIKGTTYYVSNDGSDENDGLSPKNPWKTLEKVSSAEFEPGDGVLFKRGEFCAIDVANSYTAVLNRSPRSCF